MREIALLVKLVKWYIEMKITAGVCPIPSS